MNFVEYNLGKVKMENYFDTKNDRHLKIINVSEKDVEIKIYYYYPTVFFPYFCLEKKLMINEWFEPESFYLKSCGFIMVWIDDILLGKINLLSERKNKLVRDKIICVGLNKTGTSSLTDGLKKLGYLTWADSNPRYSLEFSNIPFSNKSLGNAIDLIEHTDVDFFQDIPFSCPGISEWIITNFPQARYILTTRSNSQLWVKSVKNFWSTFFDGEKIIPSKVKHETFILDRGYVREYSYLLTMFETWEIDKYEGNLNEKLTQVYENHNLSVKKTLNTNGCDWIEIDVSKTGEFKRLTDWLEIENSENDFPWINKTIIGK